MCIEFCGGVSSGKERYETGWVLVYRNGKIEPELKTYYGESFPKFYDAKYDAVEIAQLLEARTR